MKAAKIDRNQPEIVQALREDGCFVQSLASVGRGCVDLLVAKSNMWFCLEIKDSAKPPSARKLTADQEVWHATAGKYAPVYVVESIEQALSIVRGE